MSDTLNASQGRWGRHSTPDQKLNKQSLNYNGILKFKDKAQLCFACERAQLPCVFSVMLYT